MFSNSFLNFIFSVCFVITQLFSYSQVPNVPYFYQYNNSINPGGSCQNTSMAMLLKYYGATSITPDAISTTWGTSQAQTVSGFNTVCNAEAQTYGLTGSCVSTSAGSFAAMNNLLAQGKPVVVHGYFTTYGHVMVVLAFTGTHYICNDPAGEWNQAYQGSYSGGATSGHQIQYGVTAFQDAIGPDNTLWYHYFNGTAPGEPTNLAATQSACPQNNVTFSWTNEGNGWHIDISTTSSFTNYWWKYVSGLTSYTGPAGFVDHVDGLTPLVFQSGTTYYWRITTNSGSIMGSPFTVHHCDTLAPVTLISTPNAWITDDFVVSFIDTDNSGGSGIEKGYYQVIDYNGISWRGNDTQGYFADYFTFLDNNLWTIAPSGGTWQVATGNIVQSDEALSNTNIYTSLTQNLSNRYMYHFIAKAGGSGTNRRFGFHYFCDDPSQTNRGNSYFVWFRIDEQTLEFYKVINNSFTTAQKIISNITTTADQYYDFKIIYDRITGKADVYRDNILLGSWTDPSPLNNGNAISFRTGNAKLTVDELSVYRSRAASKTITVGSSASDLRYENPSPSQYAGKIKALSADSALNLSAIVTENLFIDWTAPLNVAVNDGLGADEDSTTSSSTLHANWTSSNDSQSGISKYLYAIGTSQGATDVVDWTEVGLNTQISKSGLLLSSGQTYYFSVKAENGAGLFSTSYSDGIYVDLFTALNKIEDNTINAYFNRNDNTLNVYLPYNSEDYLLEIYNAIGCRVYAQKTEQKAFSINIEHFLKGLYILKISNELSVYSKAVIK